VLTGRPEQPRSLPLVNNADSIRSMLNMARHKHQKHNSSED
jgi:hypothetical protein